MKLTATIHDAGKRADVWLHEGLPDLSRSRIRTLIESGNIRVAGRTLEPDTRVTEGMLADISIPPPVRTTLEPEEIPLDIIHEDSEIIVVNKPAGLVVHPAAGHPSGTLVNALLYHCSDLAGIGGEVRPGIVHRLDMDTTGVLIVAKNEHAMQHVTHQFKNGRIRKIYAAIVCGIPDPPTGTVDTLIGRSRHDRKKMTARPHSGRRAITHFELVERFQSASLLRLRIETGRTHQIRVHMAHIGHPVLGDRQYSSARREKAAGHAAPRQMLHAKAITIEHPAKGRRVTYRAPLPNDMVTLIERLRSGTASSLEGVAIPQ